MDMNGKPLGGLETRTVLWGAVIVVLLGALYLYTQTTPVMAPTEQAVSTTTPEQLATTTDDVTAEEFPVESSTVLMAIDMKPWKWLSATATDGAVVSPKKAEAFSIRFNASGAFSAETDCNSISGSYEARKGALSLGSIASTKMFCEESQEGEFTELLSKVVTYRFIDNGQLVMTTSEGTEIKFR